MDVTLILEGLSLIAFCVFAWAFNKIRKSNDIKLAIEANDEIVKVAAMVVKAAQERGITEDLYELGMTKAEYAMSEAKKELESRGITFDDERLLRYIKAAVLDMRVQISGTDAEERKD